MKLTASLSLCVVFVTFNLLGCVNGKAKYQDDCLQHRDCVLYQYCSGNEFACCAPAYNDPTYTLYCWCCKQDCQYGEGNYCMNASLYYSSIAGYNRDVNATSPSEMDSSKSLNLRHRITPHQHQQSQSESEEPAR